MCILGLSFVLMILSCFLAFIQFVVVVCMMIMIVDDAWVYRQCENAVILFLFWFWERFMAMSKKVKNGFLQKEHIKEGPRKRKLLFFHNIFKRCNNVSYVNTQNVNIFSTYFCWEHIKHPLGCLLTLSRVAFI